MNIVELGFAFVAGLAMIASPCVLMLLPILLSTSVDQKSRPVFIMLGFVSGFAVVALLFAKGLSLAGTSPAILRQMAIIFLTGFSLLMLFPQMYARIGLKLQAVSDWGIRAYPNPASGKLGGLLMGLSLGAVWTPCSGPILASIISLIAASENLTRGIALLLAFGTGTSIPMLLIAYGSKAISKRLSGLARHSDMLRRGFAILMLILVGYMQWQQLEDVSGWIANKYQGWL